MCAWSFGCNSEVAVIRSFVYSKLTISNNYSHPFTADEGNKPDKHTFQVYDVTKSTKHCYVCQKKVSHVVTKKHWHTLS